MSVLTRVRAILFSPMLSWRDIQQEQVSVSELYLRYILVLSAIPAVAGFAGMSVVGIGGVGISRQVPMMTGLVAMVVQYGMTVLLIHALAWVADTLAPRFGGEKNFVAALKLVAFGSTAALVGGIFSAVPALAILTLLAAIYSIYLIYLGVPGLTRVPHSRALPYTAVLVACGVGMTIALSAVTGVVGGAASTELASLPGSVSIETSTGRMKVEMKGGSVEIDTPDSRSDAEGQYARIETPEGEIKVDANDGTIRIENSQGTLNVDTVTMERWQKRMEALNAKLEQAQRTGDHVVIEQTLREMSALQPPIPAKSTQE